MMTPASTYWLQPKDGMHAVSRLPLSDEVKGGKEVATRPSGNLLDSNIFEFPQPRLIRRGVAYQKISQEPVSNV